MVGSDAVAGEAGLVSLLGEFFMIRMSNARSGPPCILSRLSLLGNEYNELERLKASESRLRFGVCAKSPGSEYMSTKEAIFGMVTGVELRVVFTEWGCVNTNEGFCLCAGVLAPLHCMLSSVLDTECLSPNPLRLFTLEVRDGVREGKRDEVRAEGMGVWVWVEVEVEAVGLGAAE